MFYGNVSLSEGTPHLETLPKQTEGLGLEHHFHQPVSSLRGVPSTNIIKTVAT